MIKLAVVFILLGVLVFVGLIYLVDHLWWSLVDAYQEYLKQKKPR